MTDKNFHIHSPKSTEQSFRILPKYKRKFIDKLFKEYKEAFLYGIDSYKNGFRIYHQYCYEWYEPLNIELIKVNDMSTVRE